MASDSWDAKRIAVSFRPSYARRVKSGFMDRYLSGDHILDIGFRGGDPNAVPITPKAIGVELDFPGYDGITLPFAEGSQDAVLAAHVLEHISNYRQSLADWHRVLRIGGYLVIMVPHKYIYERRAELPSLWNGDHKRFYTSASLLAEVEAALPINGFRVRHMIENDFGFDYTLSPETRPRPCYEIELVLEKIHRPAWSDQLELDEKQKRLIAEASLDVYRRIAQVVNAEARPGLTLDPRPPFAYMPPYWQVKKRFVEDGAPELGGEPLLEAKLREALPAILEHVAFDEVFYKSIYTDIAAAIATGKLKAADVQKNWVRFGYFQGRVASRLPF